MSRLGTVSAAIACILLAGACAAPAEQEPPDPAHFSFVDNLLAKEEAGEWTMGEGLVATLRLFVGEVEELEVLRHEEVDEREGTGIIMMAYEYIKNGPDDDARREIARLLEFVVFSTEQLELMAGLRPEAADAGAGIASADAAPGPTTASMEKDCANLFQGNPFPGVGACLEHVSTTIAGKSYGVFYPASSWPDVGWTEAHYDAAMEAMIHTVPKFLALGEMPPVSLLFSASTSGRLNAQAWPLVDDCIVTMYIRMADLDIWPLNDFKQVVAHELAHCFQVQNFYDQTWGAGYANAKWWVEGHAEYMANLAYPDNNLEWRRRIEPLRAYELYSAVFDRAYKNFLFFQFLANEIGDQAVLSLIGSMPGQGATRSAYENALAAWENMDEMYQDFARRMSLEKQIADTSGEAVPYVGHYVVLDIQDEAHPYLSQAVLPFGVRRYVLVAREPKHATIELEGLGEHRHSARKIDEYDWWKVESELQLPDEECDRTPVMLVVTNTKGSPDWELAVPNVTDGSPAIFGRWVLDNKSWERSLARVFPQQHLASYSGTITVEFKRDFTVDVAYQNFTARGHSDVRNPGGTWLSTELTTVTNASGTTTWDFIGESYLRFGGWSEDYLVGTRVWDDKRQGVLVDLGGMYRIGVNPIDVDQMESPFDLSQSLDVYHDVRTTTDNLGWGLFWGSTDVAVECDGAILHFLTHAGDVEARFFRVDGPDEPPKDPRKGGSNER